MRGASMSAAQRQHLLLAAAQAAGKLRLAIAQTRKRLEAEIQIILDCLRAAERNAPSRRFSSTVSRERAAGPPGQRDAEIDDFLGPPAYQVVFLPVDLDDDASCGRRANAHDAFDQRALAVAVGAQQHDGLAG